MDIFQGSQNPFPQLRRQDCDNPRSIAHKRAGARGLNQLCALRKTMATGGPHPCCHPLPVIKRHREDQEEMKPQMKFHAAMIVARADRPGIRPAEIIPKP
jgi:hypothetical protein